MPTSEAKKVLTAARESLARRLSFEEFLAKLPPKDRVSAERRVTVLEAEPVPQRTDLWRRLACTLMTLSPHAAKLVGRQTVQFYIADGKYRMQVIALEDLQDGNMTIYCPDVLEEAVKAGLLKHQPGAEAPVYLIEGSQESLRIDSLDGKSLNPAAHYKDLLGWSRKALRVTLPPSATPAQVEAAELLSAIGAQHFVKSVAPAVGGQAKGT